MLVIRNEQMQAFDRDQRRLFAKRVAEYLLQTIPSPGVHAGESSLVESVVQAIDEAEGMGIRAEWDLCLFSKYQVLFGPRFFERPGFEPVQALLQDASASWPVRLRRMDEWFRGREREPRAVSRPSEEQHPE